AINRRDKIVELGYVVTRDRQGERIARETPVALIDHLLDTESRRQICADTDPDNLASNRLLERLGFTLEAVYASTALRTSAFATARSGGLPNARRTLSGRRTHTHTHTHRTRSYCCATASLLARRSGRGSSQRWEMVPGGQDKVREQSRFSPVRRIGWLCGG